MRARTPDGQDARRPCDEDWILQLVAGWRRERRTLGAFLPSDGLDRVAGAAELVVASFAAARGDDERVLAFGDWCAKDDLGVVRVGFEKLGLLHWTRLSVPMAAAFLKPKPLVGTCRVNDDGRSLVPSQPETFSLCRF